MVTYSPEYRYNNNTQFACCRTVLIHAFILSVCNVQTPGFDLGFCTLHSDMETLGMSFQLHGATVTTFAPPLDDSCLVESGLVDLGPISGDLSLREPSDCVPQRQLDFLKLADKNTKRLWFLWDSGDNCGCWGACLFQGDSIKRPLTRSKNDCAVYNAQTTNKGLENLESTLSNHTIRDIDCLQAIHRGLVEYYKHKYSTLPAQSLAPSSRPYSYVSDADDDSFVSARTSLTSLLLEEEERDFVSLDNLNSIASKLKSRPTPLSLDLGELIEGSGLETYKDISHTHILNDVQVRVRMQPQFEEEPTENRHFPVQRSRSDGAALNPKTTPKKVPSQHHLLLRLPQLSQYNAGQVPFISSRGTLMKTRERPYPTRGSEENSDGGATFSLSVTMGGPARIVLTPMASNMVHR